jgi:hypothetical protein
VAAAASRAPIAPRARGGKTPTKAFAAWLGATDRLGSANRARGGGAEAGVTRRPTTGEAAAQARAGAGPGAGEAAGAEARAGAEAGAGGEVGAGAEVGAGVDGALARRGGSCAAHELASAYAAPLTTAGVAPLGGEAFSAASVRTAELHALATAVVERAALWGDGARGVARLRLGARAGRGLASATLTLEHDGERVRLRIEGASAEAAETLRARLRGRGIEVDEA